MTAVEELINALGHRAENFGNNSKAVGLASRTGGLRPLLLFGVSNSMSSINRHPQLEAGFGSVSDFLLGYNGLDHGIPSKVRSLISVGKESIHPAIAEFKLCPHTFDVLATAKTLIAFYEGREKLPAGFAEVVADWLLYKTKRFGYGNYEPNLDAEGKRAVTLVSNALISVSAIAEVPLLNSIFRVERSGSELDPNFAYSSNHLYTVGRATRVFCREFVSPRGNSYNPVLADMFEWEARNVLAILFAQNFGYAHGIDSESVKRWDDLPSPMLPGALTHIESLPALDM